MNANRATVSANSVGHTQRLPQCINDVGIALCMCSFLYAQATSRPLRNTCALCKEQRWSRWQLHKEVINYTSKRTWVGTCNIQALDKRIFFSVNASWYSMMNIEYWKHKISKLWTLCCIHMILFMLELWDWWASYSHRLTSSRHMLIAHIKLNEMRRENHHEHPIAEIEFLQCVLFTTYNSTIFVSVYSPLLLPIFWYKISYHNK